MAVVEAFAPGRVNLIGDHTDYTGGLVLPMAIDLGTTVRGRRTGDAVRLASADDATPAVVPLGIDGAAAGAVEPAWARYLAGVVAVTRPRVGFDGTVTTTLPIGAGLSSSAALTVAVALALGFDGDATDLALACQRAEQVASGVPCGVMDPLASATGVAGHALLIDCATLAVEPIAIPAGASIVVVHSGAARALAGSAYATRRSECERAESEIGPLRDASAADVASLRDPVLRRRAHHVVTENARVRAFAAALTAGDLPAAGAAMTASHASLRDDFEVSTPALDALVARLAATPGVHGARLTGAGFGGCAVALTEPGVDVGGWPVRASAAARLGFSRPGSA
ncbi:MAG: Galactokinase [Acidimicrobiales bacterium]|jgi:galactokinase|nr:Galactokinase [Acidimicrobiales bacterium]